MFDILCEEKIQYGREAFKNLGYITLCKGNRITVEDLKAIDILLIRSGTRVDHALLDGTPVQFVASATAGTDHVDKAYLAERGIPFYHAPGCNADAVVEYVIAALLTVAARKNEMLAGKTIGVIGAGNVGSRVATRLQHLGMHVLVNDPPRFKQEARADLPYEVVSLERLLDASDIVTLHTPLERSGPWPTWHLFDEARLMQIKKGGWLVNAARGAVVDNEALKRVIGKGHFGAVVLDVWEGEPAVDVDLMKLVDIATPHIAGHSYEGKVNGTIQIYEALTSHYGLDGGWDPERILAPGPKDNLALDPGSLDAPAASVLRRLVKQMYDIEADDRRFRQSVDMSPPERSEYFLALRKTYPRRRAFDMHELHEPVQDEHLAGSLNHALKIKLPADA